jgi:hypothetical protein
VSCWPLVVIMVYVHKENTIVLQSRKESHVCIFLLVCLIAQNNSFNYDFFIIHIMYLIIFISSPFSFLSLLFLPSLNSTWEKHVTCLCKTNFFHFYYYLYPFASNLHNFNCLFGWIKFHCVYTTLFYIHPLISIKADSITSLLWVMQ